MELTITNKKAYQNYLREHKIIWRIYYKRALRALFKQSGIGILLLILGLSFLNTSTTTTEHINSVTHQKEITLEKSSINFLGATGAASILLTIFTFLSLRKREEKFMDEVSRVGKLHFKSLNESSITISEESITYEDYVAKKCYKWIVFFNFYEYENFIVLSLDKESLNPVFINKELVSAAAYQNILDFINLKVPKKKIG